MNGCRRFLAVCAAALLIACAAAPAFAAERAPDPAAAARSGYVNVGKAGLFYEEAGQGQPVILLHGGMLDRRMWDDQFGEFARSYRVVRYDARGHGLAEVEPDTFSFHEDLARLMDGLAIPRAVIVGMSMGGYVAIDFALVHPERVTALVLVGSGLSGYEFTDPKILASNEKERQADEAGSLEGVIEAYQEAWTDGPNRSPDQVNPAVRGRIHDIALTTLQRTGDGSFMRRLKPPAIDRLKEISAPTLVVVGDQDQPGIHAIAALIARDVKEARVARIAGAGHALNMEKPREFNALVLDFLNGMTAAR